MQRWWPNLVQLELELGSFENGSNATSIPVFFFSERKDSLAYLKKKYKWRFKILLGSVLRILGN